MKLFSLSGTLAIACGLLVAGTADAQVVTGTTTYYYPSTGIVQTGYATPYYTAPVYPTYSAGITFGNGIGVYYGSGYRPYYNTGYYSGWNNYGYSNYGYGYGRNGYYRGGRRFR